MNEFMIFALILGGNYRPNDIGNYLAYCRLIDRWDTGMVEKLYHPSFYDTHAVGVQLKREI